ETPMREMLAEFPGVRTVQVIAPTGVTIASMPPQPPSPTPPYFYTLTPLTPIHTSTAYSDPSQPGRLVRIVSRSFQQEEPAPAIAMGFTAGGTGPLLPPSESGHEAVIVDANGSIIFATPGAAIDRQRCVRAARQAPFGPN